MQIPDIDKLIQTVIKDIPSKVGPFNDELQENLRQALASQLKKMDIVTRHEFDIQSAVLQRTREKVELLEKQVEELEKKFSNN